MKESADELGVIYALVERFEKQRLPRLLELKKRVDKGGVLRARVKINSHFPWADSVVPFWKS